MIPRTLRIALPVGLLAVAFGLVRTTERLSTLAESPLPLTPTLRYDPSLPYEPEGGVLDEIETESVPVEFSIAAGETLGRVLVELGLTSADAARATDALTTYLDPRRLRAGDTYAGFFDNQAQLVALEINVDHDEELGLLRLDRARGDWNATWRPFERSTVSRRVAGELVSTLDDALINAGTIPALSYRMADVLQWDLDFTRDLRIGDTFETVFEEVYLDGEYYSLGDVLALSYENRGRQLEAFRYEGGYYDAQGRPLRKMFLRSPLRYSRVTSRFSHRRLHPVLKTYRPHYGVDYGAPVGTPVRVTAAGTVTFTGWNGGGGKTVKVRHPSGYTTHYLHLSKYGKGISRGAAVGQGDVIGYVGSTGLSTGPHLDYRVQKNGRWIDPLSIKSVPSNPIPTADLPRFERWRDALRASLETGSKPPTAPAAVTAIAARDESAGVSAARQAPSMAQSP